MLGYLTEYVGSHDGFLKYNRSAEMLESFLIIQNQQVHLQLWNTKN